MNRRDRHERHQRRLAHQRQVKVRGRAEAVARAAPPPRSQKRQSVVLRKLRDRRKRRALS